MSASKTHILIVDDDTSIRETLRYVLEDAGYIVTEAQDGLQALEYLRKTPDPVIVLLDMMMPRLDGAGLLGTVAGDSRRLRRPLHLDDGGPPDAQPGLRAHAHRSPGASGLQAI